MTNIWTLPTSLTIGGVGFSIRTDYRDILKILCFLSNPDYDEQERGYIFLKIMYPDWKSIKPSMYKEAFEKASEFIDAGMPEGKQKSKNSPRVMDWEQDAPILIPAINKVVGKDIRAVDYMHWWTFMAAYLEIGDSVFSRVVSIRNKKAKGKKLDDADKSFLKDNRDLVELRHKETAEEKAQKEKLRELFGLKKG